MVKLIIKQTRLYIDDSHLSYCISFVLRCNQNTKKIIINNKNKKNESKKCLCTEFNTDRMEAAQIIDNSF